MRNSSLSKRAKMHAMHREFFRAQVKNTKHLIFRELFCDCTGITIICSRGVSFMLTYLYFIFIFTSVFKNCVVKSKKHNIPKEL